jgi:DnaJ-class molecular chaperone
MRLWQKCPVCEGQGSVSRPTYVPGDVCTWASNGTNAAVCHVCGGRGIIMTPEE